ncbi:hypothetical protein ACIBSW_14300 [Actinoplanes sp. NPDC049668]|uniref:hypothetical protein n=1 Tax=unclassified Actinoplanes TaxID=2626549 RepID=UPI0033B74CFC
MLGTPSDGLVGRWQAAVVPDSEESELEYLRQVELLAQDVFDRALDEGWLSSGPDPDGATPLQQAINALVNQLRVHHFEDDGCVDPDAPLADLAGALLVSPETISNKNRYTEICARLGVEAQPLGWALWQTWNERGRPITLVTTKISTTEGMLLAWSKGHNMMPAEPARAAVAATVQGWFGPAVLSPGYAARAGVAAATSPDVSPTSRD